MFATLFLALLEPDSGTLHWVNAGHEAPVLWRAAGGHERLAPAGLAVGMFEGVRHAVELAALGPGDLLLGFSDGVSEAVGPRGPFGEASILALVPHEARTAQAVVARLQERLAAHAAGLPQHDDITLLAIGAAA